jgi:hypothetical protein
MNKPKSATKDYIKGSARQVNFNGGGYLINIDILASEFERIPKTNTGYVKLTLAPLKTSPDKYGNTHSIYVNDFVPTKQVDTIADKSKKAKKVELPKGGPTDDLPF